MLLETGYAKKIGREEGENVSSKSFKLERTNEYPTLIHKHIVSDYKCEIGIMVF